MSEVPQLCLETAEHDWMEIANKTPQLLTLSTPLGGTSTTNILIQIFKCNKCDVLCFLAPKKEN